ncbi:MAG TPA: DUF2341 domain-containing protein [Bryobacteraceae bacterium]|nr:DUF2341 domain-containing protein [Bryobacteraceae bacterium]
MLFSGTYSYLAHTDHSGNVTSASGYDIIFTSDASGSTKLDHEIESYDHETGAVVLWVRIPTLAYASDTVIYLWYGKSSISTSQENKTGVWDSNFQGVWHLGETSGTTLADSTSNGRTLTKYDASNPASATGKVGKGIQGDGTNDSATLSTNISMGTSITVQAWINHPSATYSGGAIRNTSSNALAYFGTYCSDSTTDSAKRIVEYKAGWSEWSWPGMTLGQWVLVCVTAGNPSKKAYVNGSQLGSTITDANDRSFSVGTLSIGTTGWDELRISSVIRSDSWLTADYNSQNSPSTFYTVGAADSGLSIPVLAYHCNRRRLQ